MEKLDIKKIKDRITGTVSTEKALKDTKPFNVPCDVREGRKKLIITFANTASGVTDIAIKTELRPK